MTMMMEVISNQSEVVVTGVLLSERPPEEKPEHWPSGFRESAHWRHYHKPQATSQSERLKFSDFHKIKPIPSRQKHEKHIAKRASDGTTLSRANTIIIDDAADDSFQMNCVFRVRLTRENLTRVTATTTTTALSVDDDDDDETRINK